LSEISERILKKIKEFSSTNEEYLMCKKLLERENFWINDPEPDFKGQYKKYLEEYFPYDEENES
jgi:hypothetical protein